MTAPPFLLGATLIFWSWQTGYWIIGLLLAITLEGSRLIRRRYDLSMADFNKISDLCAVIFLGMMIWRYMAGTDSAVRWLPMALFPLLVAQTYSIRGRVPLG
ncbi:MAG: transglutaminase domain-containing protein, partial [Deltaproteobacteria bacterium]|nr:transglutaminase domain-containing protein [Deltaproteobacteria bacterium]